MNNIYLSVKEKDEKEVARFVRKLQNELLERWLNDEAEDFLNYIRINAQQSERSRRVISNEIDKLSYYLGIFEGMIRILGDISQTENERDAITKLIAAQSPRTSQILYCLYENNKGHGMRHGELATAVGQSESALSNIMKRILQSGAVEVSRTGKNTFYTLSLAGQRYCESNGKQNKNDMEERIKEISKKMDELLKLEKPSEHNNEMQLKIGDIFKLKIGNANNREVEIRTILTYDNEKYVRCIETNKGTECSKQFV